MKQTLRTHWFLDIAYDDPGGDLVWGFEIRHRVTFPQGVPILQTGEAIDLLRTSAHMFEDLDSLTPVSIDARMVAHGRKLRLRDRHRELRVPARHGGSGGNMHWETYLLRADAMAHAINFLRRCRRFDKEEWDEQFVDRIWAMPAWRSVSERDLARFSKSVAREFLARTETNLLVEREHLLSDRAHRGQF